MKRFFENTLISRAYSKALRVVALLCVLLGVSTSAMGANVEVVLWKSGQSSNNYNIESATCNIEITTAGDYYFYINDYGNQKKLNNYQQMTSSDCTNFNFNGTSSDCGLKVAEGETGTFTFKIQWSGGTPIVSVVYPTSGGGGGNSGGDDSGSSSNCKTIYLKPNDNWKSNNAWFAAYFFNNSTGTNSWVKMEAATQCSGNLYYTTIPDGFPNVIICRMNPASSSMEWNNKWNQTGDLTIPTDGKNQFTLSEGVWDGATDSWSVSQCKQGCSDTPGGETSDKCYLVGLNDNWDPLDEYQMHINPGKSSEYMIRQKLAVGDEIKVFYNNKYYGTKNFPLYVHYFHLM